MSMDVISNSLNFTHQICKYIELCINTELRPSDPLEVILLFKNINVIRFAKRGLIRTCTVSSLAFQCYSTEATIN